MIRLRSALVTVLLPAVMVAAAACAAPPAATPTAAQPTAAVAATTAPPTAAPTATMAPAATPTAAATAMPASPTAAASTPMAAVSPAAATVSVKVATDAKLGKFLADAKGMTLYLYTRDAPDVSNCYDQCATNWPPLLAPSGEAMASADVTGKLATTTRKDGSKQVTYNGMPLYYWINDKNVGDTTGQGVGSVWFVVPPTTAGFPTIKPTTNQSLGPILTDLKGMTLYRFTRDEANVSNCYDQCATNWPPLLVASGEPIPTVGLAGKLGTITRKDGTKQVTYNDMPLYYWAKDAKAGDTTGQGVNNVWYVVEAGPKP